MLNDKVLAKMSDSENTDYTKIVENYWQANDEVEFATNDTEWCLINETTIDVVKKIKIVAQLRMEKYEQKMRNKYVERMVLG